VDDFIPRILAHPRDPSKCQEQGEILLVARKRAWAVAATASGTLKHLLTAWQLQLGVQLARPQHAGQRQRGQGLRKQGNFDEDKLLRTGNSQDARVFEVSIETHNFDSLTMFTWQYERNGIKQHEPQSSSKHKKIAIRNSKQTEQLTPCPVQ